MDKLKNYKVPRVDCLLAKLIKCGGKTLTDKVHELILLIWLTIRTGCGVRNHSFERYVIKV